MKSDRASNERTIPAGWTLTVRENADESLVVLQGPDGSACAFVAERGSVRAQVLQDFIIARGESAAPETPAQFSAEETYLIGLSQGELAVLRHDGRTYQIRRVAGQALEVITMLLGKVRPAPTTRDARTGLPVCEACGHYEQNHFDNGKGFDVCRETLACTCRTPQKTGEP